MEISNIETNQKDSLGLRQGFWRLPYTNGKLMYEGNYVNGERDGLFKDWYPNGQPRGIGAYIDSRLEGELIIIG